MTTISIPSQINLTDTVDVKLADEKDADGRRQFLMEANSGGTFDVGFGPAVIDFAGLSIPNSIPILRQHDPNQFLGRAREFDLGDKLMIRGFLFDTPEAEQVARMSDQGAEWQASVGISIDFESVSYVKEGAELSCNGRTFEGPLLHLKKTTLKESSFVPLGADPNTAAVALERSHFTLNLEAKEPTVADNAEAVKSDRERVKAIHSEFAADPEFALEAIASDWSLDEARSRHAVALAEKRAKTIEELEAKLAQAEKEKAELSRPNPAAQLGGSQAPQGGNDGDFDQLVADEIKHLNDVQSPGFQPGGGFTLPLEARRKALAIQRVAERHPEAHAAWLREHNERKNAGRLF